MNKRILMIEVDGLRQIDNGDGTKTVSDKVSGVSQTFRGNRMIEHHVDQDKCKHKHTKIVIVDPAGGNVERCLDCGKLIDPDLGG